MLQNKKSKRGFSIPQLILASFAFGSIMVFWTIYNSYVPLILDSKLNDLGSITLSATTISTMIGFIMAIDNFFGLIFQPMFGRKSDNMHSRYGKRMPYVIVGIVLCSVLFVLIPVMAKISGLAGVLAMMMVIIAFNFIMSTWRAPCVAIMPDMVPAEYQSEGNAVVNMVSAAFTIIASASAAILGFFGFRQSIDGGDYLPVFIFGSVIAIACLVILLTCVKWVDNRKDAKEVEETSKKQKRETLRNLNLPTGAKRSMFIMMIALFCISGTSDGVGTYFTLYATKLLSMDATTATLIKTVGTLGGVMLAVPAGIAGHKLGRRKTIMSGLGIIFVMHVFMYLMPSFAENYTTVLLAACYFIYAGAFMMININTLPIMLSIGGKERFGTFTGYYYFATFTAAVVCPVIMGYVSGLTNYNMINIIALILVVIAVICVFNVHHGEEMIEEE